MNAGHLTVTPIVEKALPLPDTCAWLCPCLDVHLHVETPDGKRRTAVRASDWLELEGTELLRRIEGIESAQGEPPDDLARLGKFLRVMRGPNGTIFGRACLAYNAGRQLGVISAGGLRASPMVEIAGVLLGTPMRAIRDSATPLMPPEVLAQWASEQAQLLSMESVPESDLLRLYETAKQVRKYGGRTASLPIALSSRGGMSHASVVKWGRSQEAVRLVEFAQLVRSLSLLDQLNLSQLDPDVLLVDSAYSFYNYFTDFDLGRYLTSTIPLDPSAFLRGTSVGRTTLGAVIHAMAEAWSVPVSKLLKASFLAWGEYTEGDVGVLENGTPVKGNVVSILRKP
jgi:hypothetical protein